METAPLDKIESILRFSQICGPCLFQQCRAVLEVPRPASENLEGEEVTQPHDWYEEAGGGFQHLSPSDDLLFESRRREQAFNAESFILLLGRQEPHGGEPAHILLFQEGTIGAVAIAPISKLSDHEFRFRIGSHDNGYVHIPGGSGPGTDGNRDPPDDSPATAKRSQMRVDPAQCALEAVHLARSKIRRARPSRRVGD